MSSTLYLYTFHVSPYHPNAERAINAIAFGDLPQEGDLDTACVVVSDRGGAISIDLSDEDGMCRGSVRIDQRRGRAHVESDVSDRHTVDFRVS